MGPREALFVKLLWPLVDFSNSVKCPCNVTHDSVTLIFTFLIIIIIIIIITLQSSKKSFLHVLSGPPYIIVHFVNTLLFWLWLWWCRAVEAVALNAPTRTFVQSTFETVDSLSFNNMRWQLVPTVDNSLAKEKLSNVQTVRRLLSLNSLYLWPLGCVDHHWQWRNSHCR